jgi:hypothetical protein
MKYTFERKQGGSTLSKRAARRIIQRAFVLTGRDKRVRQHLREACISTLWILEDRELVWTVVLDRGKIEFERRPAMNPDVKFTWHRAQEFLLPGQNGAPAVEAFEIDGKPELRRFSEPLLKGFLESLRHVLRHPVDDAGESLL